MVSSWHALTIPESRLRVDGTTGSVLSVKEAVLADRCSLTVHLLGDEPKQHDCSRENAFVACMGERMKRLLEAIGAGVLPPHNGRDNLATMAIVDAAVEVGPASTSPRCGPARRRWRRFALYRLERRDLAAIGSPVAVPLPHRGGVVGGGHQHPSWFPSPRRGGARREVPRYP